MVTIEGLPKNGKLDPLPQAFLDESAMQCGYCAPGMFPAAPSLIDRVPDPTEAEIIDHMKGDLCRCRAYPCIVITSMALKF